MKQFEHTVFTILGSRITPEFLDDRSAEGWELIQILDTIFDHDAGEDRIHTFWRREKRSGEELNFVEGDDAKTVDFDLRELRE